MMVATVGQAGLPRVMLAMAKNAATYKEGPVHVANPEEKRAVAALEAAGLVKVRRTKELCGGYHEWWFELAAKKAKKEA